MTSAAIHAARFNEPSATLEQKPGPSTTKIRLTLWCMTIVAGFLQAWVYHRARKRWLPMPEGRHVERVWQEG